MSAFDDMNKPIEVPKMTRMSNLLDLVSLVEDMLELRERIEDTLWAEALQEYPDEDAQRLLNEWQLSIMQLQQWVTNFRGTS